MRLRPVLALILAVLPVCTAHFALAQVVHAATDGTLPFAIGGGYSSYDVDWGHGRMSGAAVWADYTPRWIPVRLNGLGIEAEGRDIAFGHSSSQPSNFREATAGGGVLYTWRHFRTFRPYGKFIVGYGSIDFRVANPSYNHDTRTVGSLGVGFEYRIFKRLWLRADYEYQEWPNLFGHTLDPQGFTLGASYHFNRLRFR